MDFLCCYFLFFLNNSDVSFIKANSFHSISKNHVQFYTYLLVFMYLNNFCLFLFLEYLCLLMSTGIVKILQK